MTTFVFNEPVRLLHASKADPQKIGDTLLAIKAKHGGRLRPDDVVEHARSPRSLLHRHFEWDDTRAAAKYRLDQARDLIRVVCLMDGSEEPAPRAFISLCDNQGYAYHELHEVIGSKELLEATLVQAKRDLTGIITRYRLLGEAFLGFIETARVEVETRLMEIGRPEG